MQCLTREKKLKFFGIDFSIDSFANEISSSFEAQAARVGCDFRVEVQGLKGVEVETDLTAVRKIAQVLIDNALRYGAR